MGTQDSFSSPSDDTKIHDSFRARLYLLATKVKLPIAKHWRIVDPVYSRESCSARACPSPLFDISGFGFHVYTEFRLHLPEWAPQKLFKRRQFQPRYDKTTKRLTRIRAAKRGYTNTRAKFHTYTPPGPFSPPAARCRPGSSRTGRFPGDSPPNASSLLQLPPCTFARAVGWCSGTAYHMSRISF